MSFCSNDVLNQGLFVNTSSVRCASLAPSPSTHDMDTLSSPHAAIFKFYDIISPSIGHGVQQKGKPNDVIKIQNGDAKILLFPSLVPSLPRRFRMWDVTCQACQENSLGSKPPMLTRIARTSLGSRLIISWTRAFSKNSEWHLDWDLTSSCALLTSVIKYS